MKTIILNCKLPAKYFCILLFNVVLMMALPYSSKAQAACFPAPQEIITNTNGEASGFNLVYKLSIPGANQNWDQPSDIPYSTNNATALASSPYTRIAYYMKLHSAFYGDQWVWVSMDKFTSDINLIGIPTGNTIWQQIVSNMNVIANTGIVGSSLVNGTGISTGNIEFWSHAYSPANSAGIPGANAGTFDFGDQPDIAQPNVYGSFQIHNYGAQQTLFGYSGWSDPGQSGDDLGIGNQNPAFGQPDWTLSQIVSDINYDIKELYVLVNSSCCNGLAVTASAPAILCNNGTTTLTAVVSGGSGTYTYSLNGGTPQSGNTFTVSAGTYTVTVNGNCSATSNTVIISNPSLVTVTASAPAILCNGGTTPVTVAASGGTAPYTGTGIFTKGAGTWTFTVTDKNGCSKTTSITITQPSALSATVAIGNTQCGQTAATLTVTATGGTGTKTYRLNNGAYQASNIFIVTAGLYTITVKDANNCTFTTSIQVQTGINSNITVNIPDVYAVRPGGDANTLYLGYGPSSLTLTAQPRGGIGPYSYLWSTGATTRSIRVSPSNPGVYSYSVSVRDATGCSSAIFVKQITVVDVRCGNHRIIICHKGRKELCISENAVPGHLGHRDHLGSCKDGDDHGDDDEDDHDNNANSSVGKNQFASETQDAVQAAVTFPNPTNGIFELRLTSKAGGMAQIEIVNANGISVQRKGVQLTGQAQVLKFDLSNQAAGIYLLRIVSKEGIRTEKIIIQR